MLPIQLNHNLDGSLEVCFVVGVIKIAPCLKPVRTMLETLNWIRKYTHTHVILEHIPFSARIPLILLIPALFSKSSIFTQSNGMRAALEMF